MEHGTCGCDVWVWVCVDLYRAYLHLLWRDIDVDHARLRREGQSVHIYMHGCMHERSGEVSVHWTQDKDGVQGMYGIIPAGVGELVKQKTEGSP